MVFGTCFDYCCDPANGCCAFCSDLQQGQMIVQGTFLGIADDNGGIPGGATCDLATCASFNGVAFPIGNATCDLSRPFTGCDPTDQIVDEFPTLSSLGCHFYSTDILACIDQGVYYSVAVFFAHTTGGDRILIVFVHGYQVGSIDGKAWRWGYVNLGNGLQVCDGISETITLNALTMPAACEDEARTTNYCTMPTSILIEVTA